MKMVGICQYCEYSQMSKQQVSPSGSILAMTESAGDSLADGRSSCQEKGQSPGLGISLENRIDLFIIQ